MNTKEVPNNLNTLMNDWWSLITPIVIQPSISELITAENYFTRVDSSYEYVTQHTPSF